MTTPKTPVEWHNEIQNSKEEYDFGGESNFSGGGDGFDFSVLLGLLLWVAIIGGILYVACGA